MAIQQPGEPPIQTPVTDDKGNMTLPWHLWCVMMWKKIGGGSAMSLAWGSITGVISAQADLVAALAAKVTGNAPITGATHTKITYDSKGLVTSGSDLVAADIPNITESQVTNLVTDLAAKVPTTRSISTTAPLTGGGDLSADRTLAVSTMVGDSGSGGSRGVVPAPAAGDAAANKFLKADASWAVAGSGTVTHSAGALTAHAVVVGNGSDDEKVLAALGSSGQYLRSGGAGVDPAFAAPTDAELSTSDITTNDVSIAKHGFAPKAPNDSTKFLNGVGAYAVPPGTSTGTVTHTSAALAAHAVVVGNGGSDAETIASTGTAGQYLRSGGASADPAMASIAESEVTNLVSDLALKAPLASPALTGTPTAPTASPLTGGTQIATNAYADAAVAAATSMGGGGAIVLISEVTTAGSQASVTFSSIAATYRDLILVVRAVSSSEVAVLLQFNGDTGANYSYVKENRFGAAGGDGQTSITLGSIGTRTAEQTAFNFRIFNYSQHAFNRAVYGDNAFMSVTTGAANMFSQHTSGWWMNTAANITSVTVSTASGNFTNGSIVSLYGSY